MSTIGEAPAHLSHSQTETLLQCGQKYYLERILRAPQVPAWYFIGGSVVHAATEALDHYVLRHGMVWEPVTIEAECNRLFDLELTVADSECGDRSLWGMGGRANAKEGEEWWRTNAPKMVQRWQDWMYSPDQTLEIWTLPNGEPAIELQLLTTFGGQPVKMAIDRVMADTTTGSLLALDIKAGSRVPDGYQLPLYGAAVCRTLGVPVEYGAYWMARKGTLTPPKDLRPMVKDLDNRFEKARLMIDNEIFLAVPGMFCGSCGVRDFCSAQGGDPSPLTNVAKVS